MDYRQQLTATLLIASITAAADNGPIVLEPIVITAQRSATDWLETPAAVGAVDLSQSRQGAPNLAIDEALHRLPGIYIQNRYNFAQGERLSVRGFGARSSFGIRGVRVLLDGMPLTMPDGQTELGGLDLALVERAELIRGPASALYGNAAGGVLLLTTAAPPAEPSVSITATGGEFGFGSLRLEAGGHRGDLGMLGSAKHTEFDGFRQQSSFEENAFYGKLAQSAGDDTSTLVLNLSHTEAEDPGALTAAELDADQEQAAAANLLYNADEKITQGRLGWSLRRQLTPQQALELRLFGGFREFENRLPFDNPSGGQVAFDRRHGGLGLQYERSNDLLGRPNRLTVGLDLEHQRDDRRRYRQQPGGIRGDKVLDQEETASALGLYVADSWQPWERWTTSVALRADRVRLAVDDAFLSDAQDDSGSRHFTEPSYFAGVGYALSAQQRLYANVGSSFETPTTAELANPAGGGFNPALDPQQARSLELGFKGELPQLRYDLALFDVRVRDELVPFELPGESGRTYYRNADSSRRQGLELGVDWRPAPFWRITAAYTYIRARFDDYTTDADFSGNTIPGIPRQHLFLELVHDTQRRFAALELLAVERIEANDANTAAAPGYGLVNAKLGFRRPVGKLNAELFAGIRNLFDRDYIANVRSNAFLARYYEPGPGRHYYAGFGLHY